MRVVRRACPPPGDWPAQVPEVLRRVYAARGVLTAADADLGLSRLLPPDGLGQLDAAVRLLAQAIAQARRIVVVGDFDCDGATGTAVAVRGLRLFGATRVTYRVPNRITHGYGLSPALVDDLVADAPDLLLTVDSGVACVAGVAAARARGWQVLVTDHHLPGERLPDADVIVNPNLGGDGFPSKALAGVGVVFYLLLALRRHLRETGALQGPEPDLSCLLDLVAIGTVADLVVLDQNNRLLVAAGLRRIRQGRCQPGVRALAEVAGRPLERLVAEDIGFGIAPRLNAAGRLEDMAVGIECLLCDDAGRARELAQLLDRINAERRERQQDMLAQAETQLPAFDRDRPLPPALVLFDEAWHPGIVGLVASRMKDATHRPALAFAPAEPGSPMLRGSARSIPGFHVRDALAAVDARHPGLVERFGGHAMAAGLSLPRAEIEAFRAAFEAEAARVLDPALLQAELASDGPLAPMHLSRELALALREAGPWGQGFAPPVFDNRFRVHDWRVLGERHLKFTLEHEDGGARVPAIHFGGWAGQAPPDWLHAAYQLALDDYRGREGMQLLLLHWQPA
jgi:single-stranded-DNA-specific exonuclease